MTFPAGQGQQPSAQLDGNLKGWLEACQPTFDSLLDDILEQHQQRQAKLKVWPAQPSAIPKSRPCKGPLSFQRWSHELRARKLVE